MTGVHRDALQAYLKNTPLIQAIRQKTEVEETKKALWDALKVMQTVGVSETAQAEVRAKAEEYKTISLNYGNMIEDTWHITWQKESLIKRYIDNDIDDLPEFAKF